MESRESNPPPVASVSSAELPPELTPKRGPGRPRGSTTTKKADDRADRELTVKTLANAWQGLWLLSRLATWVLAGRRDSLVAASTGRMWSLSDLTLEESEEDARMLLPLARELPAIVLLVLTWVGAPVLLAKRIRAHLVPKGPEAPPAAQPGEEKAA